MDKYLHLEEIPWGFYRWFDWTIREVADNKYFLCSHGRVTIGTLDQIDSILEELWQTKYKSETEV